MVSSFPQFKMQILILVLLGIYAGLPSTSSTCMRYDIARCSAHLKGASLPENEEDFNQLCPSLKSYASCMQAHSEPCDVESTMDPVFIGNMEGFDDVLQTACDQTSVLHTKISENIGCLKDVFVNRCAWKSKVLEDSLQYLQLDESSPQRNLLEEAFSDVDMQKYECLNDALYLTCLATDALEKCGSDAKKIIVEAFDSVGHLEGRCTTQYRQELQEVIPKLEIDARKRKVLGEILMDGLKDKDSICAENHNVVCSPQRLGIEVTEEEIDESIFNGCPVAISNLKCLQNYKDKCSSLDHVADDFGKIVEVFEEACDENSQLHDDVAENFDCLKYVLPNYYKTSCAWTDDVMEDALPYLQKEKKVPGYKYYIKHTDNNVDGNKHECLKNALDISCVASGAAEKCGDPAKNLVVSVFSKVGGLEEECPTVIRPQMLEVVQKLDIRSDTKDILKGLLKGNRLVKRSITVEMFALL